MTRIPEIKNLGEVSERMLAEIGVYSEADLREIGAIEAYRRMRFAFDGKISLNALYAMEAGLLGIHWNHLDPARKAELKAAVQT